MDITYFLNILWKRKLLLITVAVLAALITYVIASRLPDKYKSNAILSTGIVEFKGVSVEKEDPFIQQFQVENAFRNLIEGIRSRSTIKLLTLRLLQHDLAKSNGQPFRLLVSANEQYSSTDLTMVSDMLKLTPGEQNASLLNEEMKNRGFTNVSKALEYDYESLLENLEVKRITETDYIEINFTSEKPELSYFVVKAFCEEIIELDRSVQTDEESSAVNFYKELSVEKKKELDDMTGELARYEGQRSLVNLEEQTKSIVSQIRELELLREQFNKSIPGLQSNISNLNDHIRQTARINADNYANSIFLNHDVKDISEKISALNDQWITSGMKDDNLKKRLDALKQQKKDLTNKLAAQQGKDSGIDVERNRDLLDKRIEKELDLATAQTSVESIDKEVNKLRRKASSFVSDNAYVSNLKQQIEIARKEYFDVVEKWHQAEQVSKKPGSRLSILEQPLLPDEPEPSKKFVLSAFAGAASGAFVTLLIFVLAFFDNSLSTPFKYSNFIKLPLLGSLVSLKQGQMNFRQIFSGSTSNRETANFLESVRKIRYSVESCGASVFLITSLKQGEGKTFFILSLAQSLGMTNRRVLILDMNFKNNTLSALENAPEEDRIFRKGNGGGKNRPVAARKNGLTNVALPPNIVVVGNSGGSISPSEALASMDFLKILHEFSGHYDYILIEGAALNDFADSRELVPYVDKVIGVFSAASAMRESDRESVGFLERLEEKYLGSVLNQVDRRNV
jgi:uncharacterized protein involved in exopolysaccharide biosynthesis/Mrp family chromosome partitioning ATPase